MKTPDLPKDQSALIVRSFLAFLLNVARSVRSQQLHAGHELECQLLRRSGYPRRGRANLRIFLGTRGNIRVVSPNRLCCQAKSNEDVCSDLQISSEPTWTVSISLIENQTIAPGGVSVVCMQGGKTKLRERQSLSVAVRYRRLSCAPR